MLHYSVVALIAGKARSYRWRSREGTPRLAQSAAEPRLFACVPCRSPPCGRSHLPVLHYSVVVSIAGKARSYRWRSREGTPRLAQSAAEPRLFIRVPCRSPPCGRLDFPGLDNNVVVLIAGKARSYRWRSREGIRVD